MKKFCRTFNLLALAVIFTFLQKSSETFSWFLSDAVSSYNTAKAGIFKVELGENDGDCSVNTKNESTTPFTIRFGSILPCEEYTRIFFVKNTGSLPMVCGLIKDPACTYKIFKYIYLNIDIKNITDNQLLAASKENSGNTNEKNETVINSFQYKTVDDFKYIMLKDKSGKLITIAPGRKIECSVTVGLIPEDAQFALNNGEKGDNANLKLKVYTSQVNNSMFETSLKTFAGEKDVKQ